MKLFQEHKQEFVAAIIIIGGVFVAALIFIHGAEAQTSVTSPSGPSSLQGITFPIAELGNCSSESDCRDYCNDPSHIQTCVSFAEAHGLMSKGEVEQAKTFANLLQLGETPGGCKTEVECQTYCSDITHLDACLVFAQKLGVNDEHFAQGKKILAYLKAGGKLPGGCNSEESCKGYCGDFSHAEECYNFAKNAGITQVNVGGKETNINELPPPGQMQKILELMKNSETPGGCKSKDECESYCKDSTHLDECLAFGVKAGFITQEQADMARKTGGKGPGGCDSEDSCQTYCNDPTHQQECLKFAEDHGLLSQEDKDKIQKGILQLQAGLNQAPPEVLSCLKSELGPNVIDDIKSGRLLPSPELADNVKDCFEKFDHSEENFQEIFKHLPANVGDCVKGKLGDNFDKIESGEEMPGPNFGDSVKSCFQPMELEHNQGGEFTPSTSPEGENNQEGQGPGNNFQSFLNSAPVQVVSCLKQTLGDEFDKLQSGETLPADISEKIQTCYSQMYTPPAHSFSSSTLPSGNE